MITHDIIIMFILFNTVLNHFNLPLTQTVKRWRRMNGRRRVGVSRMREKKWKGQGRRMEREEGRRAHTQNFNHFGSSPSLKFENYQTDAGRAYE